MKNFIYGFHAIEEFLKRQQPKGKLLITNQAKSDRLQLLTEMARRKKITILSVQETELDQYCEQKKHRGFLFLPGAEFKDNKENFKEQILKLNKENPVILILDEITDPHNYGAILRSADQFQVDLVITTERKAARETEVVASTSSGANAHVNKVIVTNLLLVIEFLKKEGYWIYGAALGGTPIHKVNCKGKVALILGSEGKGIRRLVKENCDFLVEIPAKGHVESFNVSVAAGILLYEIRRQQDFNV